MAANQNRIYRENEMIFREGESGDCAYLIESGQVLVFLVKDGVEAPLKTLGPGEIFGEMSMIDNSLRSASCRAVTEVSLVTVTQVQLTDRLQSPDPIVRLMMRAFMERLREQNNSGRGVIALLRPAAETAADEVEKKKALERLSLENKITAALEADQFVPFYQPIHDLRSGAIVGCEALIRWITTEGKVVSPAVFIDVLEESSMILKVGKRIIEKCLSDLKQLNQDLLLPNNFFVSINVSGRQFADPDFVDHLETTRAQYGVFASQVKLEVTERIMTEGTAAISTLQKCSDLGYKIAIDDFGTGFSSLQYLASMPLNDLKVDRSFVVQMTTHEKPLSIVKTLIFLANLLNLGLIAEGVETAEQRNLLRMLGVQMGQGYLFAKPMPYSEFVALADTKAQPKAA
jgi:EAL domain-containing protein (putative c-di-GMP-specific phosphodiesterase class I)